MTEMPKEIIREDVKLIAKCGLYCGACPRYLKKKCPGCLENHKTSWCRLRTCCLEKNIAACADCRDYKNVMECKKYYNFIARIFGFVFNSNRSACIARIKEIGYEGFAHEMAKKGTMTFKKRGEIR